MLNPGELFKTSSLELILTNSKSLNRWRPNFIFPLVLVFYPISKTSLHLKANEKPNAIFNFGIRFDRHYVTYYPGGA